MNSTADNFNDQPDTSVDSNYYNSDTRLQSWLTQAADLRRLKNTAKTQTKREFYDKKFKKLSKQIISAVAQRGLIEQYVNAAKRKELENADSSPE